MKDIPAEVCEISRKKGIAELRTAAEPIVLDAVSQQPCLHFTEESAITYVQAKKVRKALGLPKDDERDIFPILSSAAAALNKRLKHFRVEPEQYHYGGHKLIATLADDAEWEDAIREAWSYTENPNEKFLTDAGLALVEYVRSGDIESDFVRERTISYRLGLYGRERCVEKYLQEVANKTDLGLQWEAKGPRWREIPMFRLWIDPEKRKRLEKPVGLNPEFNIDVEDPKKSDLEAVRAAIYDNLLALNPPNAKLVHFIAISSRKELQRCFPRLRENSSNALFDLFSSVSLNKELLLGCDFRDKAPVWTVTLGPKDDWAKTLSVIREELDQPTLQERYGLGDEAAKLLKWIEQLPDDKKLLGRVTPIIEESVDKWIGIECPWSEENTAVYLQLLIDEINERTDYDLRLQPWREYNEVKSRIIIRQMKSTGGERQATQK